MEQRRGVCDVCDAAERVARSVGADRARGTMIEVWTKLSRRRAAGGWLTMGRRSSRARAIGVRVWLSPSGEPVK